MPSFAIANRLSQYLTLYALPQNPVSGDNIQFYPAQRQLLIANIDFQAFKGANYVMVYYDTIKEWHAYFIDGIDYLAQPIDESGALTSPAVVNITEDTFVSDLATRAQELIDSEQGTACPWPEVSAILERASHRYIANDSAIEPIELDPSMLGEATITPLLPEDTTWVPTVQFVGENGMTGLYVFNTDEAGTDPTSSSMSWAEALQILNMMLTCPKAILGGGTPQNISFLHAYVLPYSWIADRIATHGDLGDYELADADGSPAASLGGISVSTAAGGIAASGMLTLYGFEWEAKQVITPDGTTELKTAATLPHVYGLPTNINYPLNWTARLLVGNFTMNAQNPVTAILWIEGDEIDISSAFEMSIVVNEQALAQSQNKISTNIALLSSVVGAAGGVVGGVASGNWFGAVSALAGGAGNIADIIAAKHQPAQIKGGGDGGTALQNYRGIGIVRRNFRQISAARKYGENILSTYGGALVFPKVIKLADIVDINSSFPTSSPNSPVLTLKGVVFSDNANCVDGDTTAAYEEALTGRVKLYD